MHSSILLLTANLTLDGGLGDRGELIFLWSGVGPPPLAVQVGHSLLALWPSIKDRPTGIAIL